MFGVISQEMINTMATIIEFNNLVGEMTNKYRGDYKDFTRLRNLFFEKIENNPDLDKFIDYYKWIDNSLSVMIQQLVPASADVADEIRTIVESHIFERSKYRHKMPLLDYKGNSRWGGDELLLEARAFGINELAYNWKHGHAPTFPITAQAPVGTDIIQIDPSAANDRFTVNVPTALGGTGVNVTIRLVSSAPSDGTANEAQVREGSSLETTRNRMVGMINGHDSSISAYGAGSGDITNGIAGITAAAGSSTTKITITAAAHTHLGGTTITFTDTAGTFIAAGATGASPATLVVPTTALEKNNALWWKERAERDTSTFDTATSIDTARQTISDVILSFNSASYKGRFATSAGVNYDGSTYALRRFASPVRMSMDLGGSDKVIKSGYNFPRTQKPESITRILKPGSTANLQVTTGDFKDINVEETGDPILTVKRPFITETSENSKIHSPVGQFSSSLGTTEFAGLHTDAYGDHYETSMQGPFSQEHVGGYQHRHTKLNTGTDIQSNRQEAWELFGGNTFTTRSSMAHPPAYSSYQRDEKAKRPVNLRNVQSVTGTATLGNYQNAYEVVQTSGRRGNNSHFVKSEGFSSSSTVSAFIDNANDYTKPTRPKRAHVFVNRFSAPGGPETAGDSNGGPFLDLESAEFSPYNEMNSRNLTVRKPLQELLTEHNEQFGFRSGSSTIGAIYKVNRNRIKRLEYTDAENTFGSLVTASSYDNYYVNHPIPQSDRQYAWITSSYASSSADVFGYWPADGLMSKVLGATATISVTDSDAASGMSEKESITITSTDGTVRRYVIVEDNTTAVATGAALTTTSDTGANQAGTKATAVNCLDTTGVEASSADASFTILITTAAGGEHDSTAVTILLDDSATTNPADGANTIAIGTAGISDAAKAAALIDAINGVSSSLVDLASSGVGAAGVQGVTATQGSSNTQITLTMDAAGVAGNLTNAITTASGVDIVDVRSFTTGAEVAANSVAVAIGIATATAATAVDCIDLTGAESSSADVSFTILIPTSAGGLGGDAITFLLDDSATTAPAEGANKIAIGTAGISDADKTALLIKAINGVADDKIDFASSGNGQAGYNIGVTAAEGSSNTQITLTNDTANFAGNLTNAITTVAGVNVVDVRSFTGGLTSDTQNAFLVQLKAAIESDNGHGTGNKIKTSVVPTTADGVQRITLTQATTAPLGNLTIAADEISQITISSFVPARKALISAAMANSFVTSSDLGTGFNPSNRRPLPTGIGTKYINTDFAGINSTIITPISASDFTLGYPLDVDVRQYYNFGNIGAFTEDTANTEAFITKLSPNAGSITNELAFSLNNILSHRNGPYGHPTWKQLRVGQGALGRHYRNSNLYTHTPFGGDELKTNFANAVQTIPTRRGNTLIVSQSTVTSKFHPIKQELLVMTGEERGKSLIRPMMIVSSYGNNVVYFDDPDFANKLGIEIKKGFSAYNQVKNLYLAGALKNPSSPVVGVNRVIYTETVWPSLSNAHTSKVRGRTDFTNNFWRDGRTDRTTLAITKKYTNTAGLAVSQSAWSLDANEDFVTLVTELSGGTGSANTAGHKAGELQNEYVHFHQGDARNTFAGALYARKHLFPSTRSVAPDWGFDIPSSEIVSEGRLTGPHAHYLLSFKSLLKGDALWEAGANAGTYEGTSSIFKKRPSNPFYDSYDEYFADIKPKGKDYSIIPEFRVTEHLEFYRNQGYNYNSENEKMFSIAQTPSGAATPQNSSEEDFFKVFTNSDFMKHFTVVRQDHEGVLEPHVLRLKCKAIKKFVPYDGFYPAERTTELVKQFMDSYGEHVSFASGTDTGLNNFSQYTRNFIKPLFAPGILYNTIKSGLAVDYPIMTGRFSRSASINIVDDEATTGPGNDFVIAAAKPRCTLNTTSASFAIFSNSNANSRSSVTRKHDKGWDKRIPFEALLEPEKYLAGISINDDEPSPLARVDATVEWSGEGDSIYRHMAHNFFAESANFFLEGGKTTGISSLPEANFKEVTPGQIYGMRIKLWRSMDTGKLASGSWGNFPVPQNTREVITIVDGTAGGPRWDTRYRSKRLHGKRNIHNVF